ncbi:hypothetical protein CP981_35335 [Streptomyces platensis]|uniref:Uncharacterized protein n=1 Tax=Streptomyces platensis TaxID=58346 RepID=A0AAE6TQY4_STRPT|nr:hypothetical protein CP981_35335 [Streptomyces platensis]
MTKIRPPRDLHVMRDARRGRAVLHRPPGRDSTDDGGGPDDRPMRPSQGVPLPMRPEPMPHDVTVAGPAHGGQRRTGPTATAPAIRRTTPCPSPPPSRT